MEAPLPSIHTKFSFRDTPHPAQWGRHMLIFSHLNIGGGRDRRSAAAEPDAARDADAAVAGRPSQTESRDVPLTKKLLALLGNQFVENFREL